MNAVFPQSEFKQLFLSYYINGSTFESWSYIPDIQEYCIGCANTVGTYNDI